MKNERVTENIVRNLLRERGYYNDENIIVEEQSSTNPKIHKLLKTASKIGYGIGRPEFIISFKNNTDDLIIVECKADTSKHESKDRKQYKDYAVDGVLLYSSYLKNSFNVTAIAVSGQSEMEIKISTFLWLKQHYIYKDIQDKIFLKYVEIQNIIEDESKPFAEEELIKRAVEYNKFLHNYSIPEIERCTLISAVLTALQHKPFLNSYKDYESNTQLIEALLRACSSVLEQNGLDLEKIEIIISEYSKFKNNKDFNSNTILNKKTKKDEINTILRDFILSINQDILPNIHESQFDVLGKFYTQFIRYAGSDKKTGLVLTPSHITDFFCDVADLSVDDIVFDPCCGTAGFLVSAMNHMLKKAGNNTDKHKIIKSSQLIGIEKRSDMFSHACSNMMMRGDGKSHILHGSCFDEKNKSIIKAQKPTKGFLNPPYYDGNSDEQLEFIENTLECLNKDGICVAICQMSTVVSENKYVTQVKERLLAKHSLEAVFSMPKDLFHPLGVNTCILVFKAHAPHPQNKKTFFGYFKDDGFIKQKNSGRVDKNNKWKVIKESWLEHYTNKESVAGLSIVKNIKAKNEWCVEAYLETNYKDLTNEDFVNSIKSYLSFEFLSNKLKIINDSSFNQDKKYDLYHNQWGSFCYDKQHNGIFEITRGKRHIQENRIEGEVLYFSASEYDNGCTDKISNPLFIEKNSIIYSTFGDADYIDGVFTTSDEVSIFKHPQLNKFTGLFIATIIKQNKYKYSFGRKAFKNKFIQDKIQLPTTDKGLPDWDFMENYIKSLPYSSSL